MKRRVLVVLALAAAPLVVAGVSPEAASAAPRVVSASSSTAQAESQLFSLLNGERTSRGLAPLVRLSSLDSYAQAWSQFMAGGGCQSQGSSRLCHRGNLAAVADAAAPNGWIRAGENVGLVPAGGTIDDLHQAFVRSPAHLANILQPLFNAVGVGVGIDAQGTLYATYEFVGTLGSPGSHYVAPPPPAANPVVKHKAPRRAAKRSVKPRTRAIRRRAARRTSTKLMGTGLPGFTSSFGSLIGRRLAVVPHSWTIAR